MASRWLSAHLFSNTILEGNWDSSEAKDYNRVGSAFEIIRRKRSGFISLQNFFSAAASRGLLRGRRFANSDFSIWSRCSALSVEKASHSAKTSQFPSLKHTPLPQAQKDLDMTSAQATETY